MVWIKYRITLLNKDGDIVATRLYTCGKGKNKIIQQWKYRYGKKFLELRVEDEKDLSIKNYNK